MRIKQFQTDLEKTKNFQLLAGREFLLEKSASDAYPLEFFDTFDWRLYRKGYFAYKKQDRFIVADASTMLPAVDCRTREVPRFSREFKDEEIRDFLKSITGIRAILPLASAELNEDSYTARNKDQKIICRFSVITQEGDQADNDRKAYLLIKPLRGYSKESNRLCGLAGKSKMKPLDRPCFEAIVRAGGATPGGYSSKLDIKLRKSMNITEASLIICRRLLDTATANISGVIEDIDTEFVHDFRVATRRTRACLSELKEALPAEETAELNSNLKTVAQRCNELRDLDVYLLEKQKFYDMLPPDLHPGLNRYFAHIKRKRNSRQKQFSKFLKSDEFHSILQNWNTVLNDPDIPLNETPALKAAKFHIYKRFRRIIKRGRKITDDSPDEKLHSLRIDCKKLRYLLEFFRSYFPGKKMEFLIGHLKDFQDNLGEFNDLAMQRINLNTYLEAPGGKAEDEIRAAAIGGLLTALNKRQAEVRAEFYSRFSGFDSKEVHSLFEELFGTEKL